MSLVKLANEGYKTKDTWKHRGIGALAGASVLGLGTKGIKGKVIRRMMNQGKEILKQDSPFAKMLAHEHAKGIIKTKKWLVPGAIASGLVGGAAVGGIADRAIQNRDNSYQNPTARSLFSLTAASEKSRNTSAESSLAQARPIQAVHGMISRSLHKRKENA